MVVQYACKNVRRGEGDLKVGGVRLSLVGNTHRVGVDYRNEGGGQFCWSSSVVKLISNIEISYFSCYCTFGVCFYFPSARGIHSELHTANAET